MSNCLPLNDFHIARPRGQDMRSATPKRKGRGAEPSATRRVIKTLDSKGRQTVSLAPRVLGSISIEPREQAIASTARNQSIKRGAAI